MYLAGFRNRLVVLLNREYYYFFRAHQVRGITADEPGVHPAGGLRGQLRQSDWEDAKRRNPLPDPDRLDVDEFPDSEPAQLAPVA